MQMFTVRNKCLFRKGSSGKHLQVSAVTTKLDTCVGVFRGGCTKENKKELLRSQPACQGILVGVCIELSQFEGTVWRLFISCYFCIHCSKGNYLLPYMDFSALLLRQRLIASCVVLGRTEGSSSPGGRAQMISCNWKQYRKWWDSYRDVTLN